MPWLIPLLVNILFTAVISGVTYAITASLAPGLGPTPSSTIDRLRSMRRGTTEAVRIGYGLCKTSGVLFYARSVNRNGLDAEGGKVLHLGLALAEGPIDAVEEVFLNDELASSDKFVERAMFVPQLGWKDQQPLVGPFVMGDAGSLELPEDWSGKFRPLSGIAYVWGILRHSLKVFPAGAPVVLIRWRGRLIYDPRLDVSRGGYQKIDDEETWSWTQNWALIVRDFLVSRRYGMKVKPEEICEDCLIDAADASDDPVDAPTDGIDGDTGLPKKQPRYTINGVFEASEKRLDVLSKLLQAGAGSVVVIDGLYHILPGIAESTVKWPEEPGDLGFIFDGATYMQSIVLPGDTPTMMNFSAWVYPTAVPGQDGSAITVERLDSTGARRWGMFLRPDLKVECVGELGASIYNFEMIGATPLTLNAWNHVAWTYWSGGFGFPGPYFHRLYVNGDLDGTYSSMGGGALRLWNRQSLGGPAIASEARTFGAYEPFTGHMVDVRMVVTPATDERWSDAEIIASYNLGELSYDVGPDPMDDDGYGWWQLNETSGIIANGTAGGGPTLELTVVGNAIWSTQTPGGLNPLAGQEVVLTELDLRDDTPFSVTTQPGRNNRVNLIRGTCIDPQTLLQTSFPDVTHADFLAADKNTPYPTDIEYSFVHHVDRARRIAAINLVKSRLGQRVLWPANPRVSSLVPGNVVKVTVPRFGWNAKQYQVADRSVDQRSATDLSLNEYDDDIFTFPIDPALLPSPTDLDSPFTSAPPANLALSLVHKTLPDGSRSVWIGALITPPATGSVSSYRVRWYTDGIATQSVDTVETYVELPTDKAGTWTVTAQALVLGVPSNAIVRSIAVLFDSAAPPTPIDFRVTTLSTSILWLTWRAGGTSTEIVLYEVRALAGVHGADPLAEWNQAFVVWLGVSTDTTFPATTEPITFYVRAFDGGGNYSVGVAWLVETHVPTDTAVVLQRNYKLEQWPLGFISGGRINVLGELESVGALTTWDELTTWDAFAQWDSPASGSLVYMTPISDLGRNITARAALTINTTAGGSVMVYYRRRINDAEVFSSWNLVSTVITGRQVQFAIVGTSPGGQAIAIREFAILLTADLSLSIANDWEQPSTVTFVRDEVSDADWRLGDQAKVLAQNGTLTLDWPVAIDLDADAYVERTTDPAPADDKLILYDDWTIEFVMKVDAYNGDSWVLIKGDTLDGWNIPLSESTVPAYGGDSFVLLNFGHIVLVPDLKKFHHYAWVSTAGEVTAYVDGEVAKAIRVVDGLIATWPIAMAFDPVDQEGAFQLGINLAFKDSPDAVFDYVRIWRSARSLDDLRAFAPFAIRNVEFGGAGLALEWALDDGAVNPATTTATDTGPHGYHGTMSGTAKWVRAGWRESPPVDLGLFPGISGIGVEWGGTAPASTSIEVEASVDEGATWVAISEGVPKLVAGTIGDGLGKRLRIRAWLYSDDLAAFPAIDYIKTTIVSTVGVGDVVIQAPDKFAYIAAANIRAIQGSSRYVASWETVARDPLGARFSVRDGDGLPFTPEVVDVDFFGVRA